MKIRLIQKIKYDILSSHECLVTLGYFENVEPSKFLRETGAGNIFENILLKNSNVSFITKRDGIRRNLR